MRKIQVKIKNNPYTIHVKSGLLIKSTVILNKYNHGQKWIILTQPNLDKLYGESLQELLINAGFNVKMITFPDGEKTKNLAQIETIYTKLVNLHCDRSTVLVALGGGVVGDIVGFVAATFMRGIKYIQIPTTLLSMVDSAVGGKTGVNLLKGKNLIGSIYQPKTVLIDPTLLKTLPVRELVSGYVEILKYGLIKDSKFFNTLIGDSFSIESYDMDQIQLAIIRSCEIKSEIVSMDEKDTGIRRILNFGHTIGHALENYYGYNQLRHGEAVAYGILCSSWISHKNGKISNNEWNTIKTMVRELALPKIPSLDSNKILNIIKHDKKIKSGELHFILLNGIGNAVISNEVSDINIIESLNQITQL